jgi:hypothetical protein
MQVALLLALIRLGLALAGVGASILRGVGAPVAFVTFGVGLALLAFSVISTRQGMWSGQDVRVEQPLRVALSALYPSSIALAVLTAIALVLKPQLAALTAGMLAGLGCGAAAVTAQIAWARR